MGTDLHRRFVLVVLCCGRPMVAPTQKHAPVAAHDDMRQHTHKAACTHAFRRPVEPLGGSKTGGAHIGAARLAAEVSGHYGRRNDGSGREKRGGRMAAPRGVGITLRDRDTGR